MFFDNEDSYDDAPRAPENSNTYDAPPAPETEEDVSHV